jgi:argonaute-like protein implicated in RNA metabolism and viral defense
VILDAVLLTPPRLRFDAAVPSRVHAQAYQGLRLHGPFDASAVTLPDHSVLFVYPKQFQALAHHLAEALRDGYKSFPGFEKMFRVPFRGSAMAPLPVDADVTSPAAAARSYREAIDDWSKTTDPMPQLALVLVPHSERWETDRPYYEAKAAFARLGIPTQMVTTELLANEREFTWSVANIALASFAKLGGVPWTLEAPAADRDLVIGVGRADVRRVGGPQRIFGYAVTFISNGVYRHTWSFTPAADEASYLERLEEALVTALEADREYDEPVARLIVHLTKQTGRREIEAVRRAMGRAQVSLPAVFMRVDDSTLYDIADARQDTFAPPKGLLVKVGDHQRLLQTEGIGPLGPPDGPLLIQLDERSDVGPEALDELAAQAFRLAHANWRAFNARSHPVTVVYGELLAKLVGYLEEVETWDPTLLRGELRNRPWFL